jgi:hypothetical protein
MDQIFSERPPHRLRRARKAPRPGINIIRPGVCTDRPTLAAILAKIAERLGPGERKIAGVPSDHRLGTARRSRGRHGQNNRRANNRVELGQHQPQDFEEQEWNPKTKEPVAFATKESLEKWRASAVTRTSTGRGVGRVILQSAMAGEWIKIDSARQRAHMAAAAGQGERARERDARLLARRSASRWCWTTERKTFFTIRPTASLILALDSAITDELATACVKHCDIDSIDLRALEKN